MEKEQLYDTIEAYLEGALDADAQAVFERELAKDGSLAKEVELHRRLQRQLSDPGKMDLRATLDAIASEFPESDLDQDIDPDTTSPNGTSGGAAPNGRLPFWWYGLGFAVLVGVALLIYLSTLSSENNSVSPSEQVTIAEDLPDAAEMPAEDLETETSPQENISETSDAGRPGIYDTNKDLELLVGQEASRRYIFTEGQLTYNKQSQSSYLIYSSKLTTDRSVEEGFFLSLYTNEYPDGRVLRVPLEFSEVDPDAPIAFAAKKEYFAAYTGETELKPALYYGVVTVGNSSLPLWVGKVKVE